MNIERIKQIVEKLLEKESMRLYSIKTKRQYGLSILEIIVDGNNLDAAYLGELNKQINDLIDEHLPQNYYIEVSSPGAIRPINSLEEAKNYIGRYVLAQTNKESIKGILEKVDESIFIKVNLKGRMKTMEVPYKDIIKFKLTVKF